MPEATKYEITKKETPNDTPEYTIKMGETGRIQLMTMIDSGNWFMTCGSKLDSGKWFNQYLMLGCRGGAEIYAPFAKALYDYAVEDGAIDPQREDFNQVAN